MSQTYKYFMIPFASVPRDPAYTVWFASWSAEWPTVEPGTYPPVVVGVTTDHLPAGAVLLGAGSKDPPPCPPPLAAASMSDYQKSVSEWLELSRDA